MSAFSFFCLLLYLVSCLSLPFQSNQDYSVLHDTSNDQWTIVTGCEANGVACAIFRATSDETGWNTLDILTNSSFSDELQAFGLGFIEGGLTQKSIWDAFRSFANGTTYKPPNQFSSFIMNNDKWVRSMVDSPPNNADYWYQVGLVLKQFDGLVQGYNQYAPPSQQLSFENLLIYQLQFELSDIYQALGLNFTEYPIRRYGSHCSSLVKPTPDGRHVFASHATWNMYSSMLRVYKHYDTPFSASSTKASGSSFSSYPGSLYSGDDFFITSTNLVVMETTNDVMNATLYQFTTEETVMYWIRIIVANRMSTSGSEWLQYFSMYNSGTYNNQWIIVDYKKFTPARREEEKVNVGLHLQPGFLWIIEQIPGYVEGGDQTSHLLSYGYWASYNIPFYEYVYNISGFQDMEEKYGDEWSYTKCARAQIFRRDQNNVVSMDDMKHIMRYNQYQTDPLARQDACKQISARCDLNPPWVVDPLNVYSAFGATDTKITDDTLSGRRSSLAVSGPTWDSQNPFAWTGQFSDPHWGQPKVFDFDFEPMAPSLAS